MIFGECGNVHRHYLSHSLKQNITSMHIHQQPPNIPKPFDLTSFRPSKAIPLIFILEEINIGGTQRQMLELSHHLDKTLFAPEIWTIRGGEDFLALANEYGVPVHFLRTDAKLKVLPAAWALWKELGKRRPPIIHLHTTFPNVWGRILGRLRCTPVIIGSIRSKRNVRKQKERLLWRFTHAHICNAASLEQDLLKEGLPSERLFMIPNGIDTQFFTPSPTGLDGRAHIINVGRLVKEKNQETLLRAFALVQQKIPEAHLHMVGDGYLREYLQSLTDELGLSQHVTFHGASNNVKELLQGARIFALSSIDEGTPNAILEAMACGLPIVSTKVDGIAAMLVHAEHGYLVDVYQHETMANYILKILETPQLAEKLGAQATKYVQENYSLKLMALRHEAVYLSYYRAALAK